MEEELLINVDITNIGEVSGYETVQLYVKDLDASVVIPRNGECKLEPGRCL
ncbi:hypothetical protein [Vallitalea longa]|uniref:hypothetical protein n=1 Tax=Vallitalea longa TaxID=2936439 RepID=UPI00248F934C|nr:hypothetical protein [Vallitalea longa]